MRNPPEQSTEGNDVDHGAGDHTRREYTPWVRVSALARYRALRDAGASRHGAAREVAASVGCALETVLVWAGDRRGHRPEEVRSMPSTSERARLRARHEREKDPERDAAAER